MLSHEAQELVLFIENDGDLYRQRTVPIMKNLANKAAQGKYDHGKSIKLWMYLMDDGAKRYAKEFATPAEWNKMFSVSARKEAAKAFADDFEANWKAGEYRYYLTKTSAKKLAGDGTKNRVMGSKGTYPAPRASRPNVAKTYHVYLGGKKIDTVFFTGYTADEVRKSLINHDGYDPAITVTVRRSTKKANRSGTTKPRPYGTDRDRYHGNPNARRNRAGSRKPKYSGWFLSDGQLTLAIRGHEQLVRQPKKGIPSGAFDFRSKESAEDELAFIRRQNRYPLWSDKAHAVQLTWT